MSGSELEMDADTLPVVLSLVDDVAAQDESIQAAIIAAMSPDGGSSGVDQPQVAFSDQAA
jgi:hypothetical protein